MRNNSFHILDIKQHRTASLRQGKQTKSSLQLPQFIARDQCMEVEPRQNLEGVHELRNGIRVLGV